MTSTRSIYHITVDPTIDNAAKSEECLRAIANCSVGGDLRGEYLAAGLVFAQLAVAEAFDRMAAQK